MKKLTLGGLLLVLATGLVSGQTMESGAGAVAPLALRAGWTMQSSCKVEAKGAVLSSPGFDSRGWYKVSVPTTVVAALVKDGVYPDPYFGMNLRSLPGVDYPIGGTFLSLRTPQDSPYIMPWWFRKEFVIPSNFSGKT